MLNCKLESSDEILRTPYEPSEQDHLFDFEKESSVDLSVLEKISREGIETYMK